MSTEIEEIKNKIDLVELIRGYIKLIPAGANFKALCPFHNEKTPSFMVNSARQIYKCFGCGEGGDAFDFIMKIEGLDFPATKKLLAAKAGVQLQNYNYEKENKNAKLYKICELAGKYFNKIILETEQGKKGLDYLKKRGLSEETIEDFSIGYTPDGWDNLLKFLVGRGYGEQEIFLAGLSAKREKSVGYYDRFRNRVMFPIRDLTGRVVGFGGRTLDSDEKAKYINSPQTPIYNKSAILYGLHQARQYIRKEDLAVVVEGYMDVVPSHQAGVKNVFAACGTALTFDQLKIVKRYTSNLAIALDMDEAGRKASEKSIDLGLEMDFNVRVVVLSSGKDPGDLIAEDESAWEKSISDAKPFMEYYMNYELNKIDLSDVVAKKKTARKLLEKISKISSKMEQDHWLGELSNKASIGEDSIRQEFESINKSEQKNNRVAEVKENSQTAESVDEKYLIRLFSFLFVKPALINYCVKNIELDYWQDESILAVYKSLVLYYNSEKENFDQKDHNFTKDSLFDGLNIWFSNNFKDRKPAKLLASGFMLAESELVDLIDKDVDKQFYNLIALLKDRYLKVEIEKLKETLNNANLSKVEGADILKKINYLVHQRKK